MKRLIVKVLFLTFAIFAPISAMAGVSVHIDIPMPPPIIFPMPPQLVVIPQTEVYAVPDIQDDIFFYSGWWWRPWQGRWYRSRYYDRGWAFYPNPPYFHHSIPPQWRDNYRNHRWNGYKWNHKPIPHHELQRNWDNWKKNRHWEQQRWGMQGLHRRPAPKYRYEGRKPQPKPQQRYDRGPGQRPVHPR